MDVNLLKLDIKEALNERDEKTRVGMFSVYTEVYENSFPMLKEIFSDKRVEEAKSEECTIKRCEKGFEIQDSYGGHDFFTNDEIAFFIDLYEKAEKVPVNIVYMPPIWTRDKKLNANE